MPFNPRFADVTTFQRDVYFVTLLATAVSTALLLARLRSTGSSSARTTGAHRVRRNRCAIAGFGALLVAMTGTVLLVTDFFYSSTTAAIATTGVGLMLVLF